MAIRAPDFRIGSSFCVTFSPDGEHLAVVGQGVVLWSVSKRKRLRSNRMLRYAAAVAFSPDGASFVVKNTLGEMLLCETATADPIARFKRRGQDEGAAPLFATADLILDGSWSGEIRARDVTRLLPRVLWKGANHMVVGVMQSTRQVGFAVTARCDPSGKHVSCADQILIGDASDKPSLRALERKWDALRRAALSPDGDRVAVRHGRPEQVEIVDLARNRVVASSSSIAGGTGHNLAWSPDGCVIVLIEKAGFSFRRSADLAEIGWVPSLYPSDVAFSKDGQFVAFGDWSKGVVRSWPAVFAELGNPRPSAPSSSVV
ncbi:MAG: hypothetical protein NVS1B4_17490 [Gemmatimonadaceae bacterium]